MKFLHVSIALSSLVASLRAEVSLVRQGERWELHRDGAPFFVRGANVWGETGYLPALRAAGGNAVRTYRAEDTAWLLGRPEAKDFAILAGFGLGKPRQGFDYADSDVVRAQNERVLADVRRWKGERAILAWALGNEIELHHPRPAERPRMWREIEALARAVRAEDPSRPTAIVLAGIDAGVLREVAAECPSVDLVCFNVYGSLPRIGRILDGIGWKRPYLVTEFGAPGYWEVEKTPWGAEFEATSTQKAAFVARAWREGVLGDAARSLGGFVFFWQPKQEATATWFGLFTPEGERLGAVDVLTREWTGRAPAKPCPELHALDFADGFNVFAPGAEVVVRASWRGAGRLSARWEIAAESDDRGVGGDAEKAPRREPVDVRRADDGVWTLRAPRETGGYRLFLFVSDERRAAATGNLPFRVE